MGSIRSRRAGLLTATAMAGAMLAPQAAYAQAAGADDTPARPVVALGGPVVASGNIRTFGGDVTASGNIRTFQGDVDPYGNIRTFAGSLLANGNIRTFNGAINPYIGNIRTFSGDLNPFVGNIRTFWGQLTPTTGALNPLIGNIRTFAGSFDSVSVDLLNSWNVGAASGNYAATASKLNELVAQGQAAWGAAVAARTGKSFAGGFADPLFAKYGIDPANAGSLAALDAVQRQLFLMEWYDGLMSYSGMDQVDHWMSQVNWSPSLTETIGEGRRSVIGLLDFTVTGDGTSNIVKYDGISTFANGHGSAVASLMIAAHDGKGVMGIAPMASVVAYNPFDASGTADWADVRTGVQMLAQNGASIINMSLGVPGWTLNQGWNSVFTDPAVAAVAKSAVFVVAAGNDGSSQTQNIVWNAANPKLIIVGSVDPTNTISSFSNRPGTACLVTTATGPCAPGNRLMDRYIVAPGELILVSDGMGGTTRMSGTSFAAPLVSGTVALLHDRWPWLAKYPGESVDIVLRTAKDLGAPGTDEVYGRGLLDVTAALSPISFDTLKWYTYDDKGRLDSTQADKIRRPSEVAKWEAKGLFFYAYEEIGGSFRDFAIPASSKLADQSAMSAGGTMERLQAYIYQRFLAWVNGSASKSGSSGKGFAGFATAASPIPNTYGLNMTMAITPRPRTIGFQHSNLPFQSALRVAAPDERFALTVGEGDGALMLGDTGGFGFASDYDPYVGGVNPLLGYASGGGYIQAKLRLGDRWTVAANATGRTLRRDFDLLPLDERAGVSALGSYRADAQTMSATYAAGDAFSLTGTYSHLSEANAVLGLQSTDRNDLSHGSATDGASLGADIRLARTLSLTASGTLARTRAGGSQNFAIGGRGLVTSAFQVGVAKTGLFDPKDQLRLTVAQPMHLEAGRIDVTMVKVVDRQEGALGAVTDSFDLSGPQRQFIGEAMYGRSFLNDTARFSLFGRFNLRGAATEQAPAVMAGAGLNLRF